MPKDIDLHATLIMEQREAVIERAKLVRQLEPIQASIKLIDQEDVRRKQKAIANATRSEIAISIMVRSKARSDAKADQAYDVLPDDSANTVVVDPIDTEVGLQAIVDDVLGGRPE